MAWTSRGCDSRQVHKFKPMDYTKKFLNLKDIPFALAIIFVGFCYCLIYFYPSIIPDLMWGKSLHCYFDASEVRQGILGPRNKMGMGLVCPGLSEDASILTRVFANFVVFFGPLVIAFFILRFFKPKLPQSPAI